MFKFHSLHLNQQRAAFKKWKKKYSGWWTKQGLQLQCYHSQDDLILPDGTFKLFNYYSADEKETETLKKEKYKQIGVKINMNGLSERARELRIPIERKWMHSCTFPETWIISIFTLRILLTTQPKSEAVNSLHVSVYHLIQARMWRGGGGSSKIVLIGNGFSITNVK
jgi:hypothetical protein